MNLIYLDQVITILSKLFKEKCYGCINNSSEQFLHNVCSLPLVSRIQFCLPYVFECINDDEIIHTYYTQLGLAAFEWQNEDIFDVDYRQRTWQNNPSWKDGVWNLLINSAETLFSRT